MYIAKQISTGKYINDFQSNATPEGLIKNALSFGIQERDVEIIKVDEATFKEIVETETSEAKAQLDAERILNETELKQIGQAVMQTLGLSRTQMKKFILFIRQVDVDSF